MHQKEDFYWSGYINKFEGQKYSCDLHLEEKKGQETLRCKKVWDFN